MSGAEPPLIRNAPSLSPKIWKRSFRSCRDVVDEVQARLVGRIEAVLGCVGRKDQIERPILGLAAELLEVISKADGVERAGAIGEVIGVVAQRGFVDGDLFRDREKAP